MRGALYLRWRPQVFANLVGQDHIKNTLLNALKKNKVGHAYLFCGPRGTGKTTTARLLAKALNCEKQKNGEPCNKCENCIEVNENKVLDLIEIDAASNRGIDEIRDLRDKSRVAPAKSKYKIFIIDEVHMLTKEAFNALLKTLEEPPKHVIFILATTEVQKVPVTILSRCQRFDFHLINQDDLRDKLKKIAKKEEIKIDDDSLDLIIRKARGSYRDSESLLDQLSVFSDNEIDFEITKTVLGLPDFKKISDLAESLLKKDGKKSIRKLEEILDGGEDPEQLVLGLVDFFRNCLLVKIGGDDLSRELSKDDLELFKKITEKNQSRDFILLLDLLNQANAQLKVTDIQRLPLEIAVLDFCKDEAKSQDLKVQSKIGEGERSDLSAAPSAKNAYLLHKVAGEEKSKVKSQKLKKDEEENGEKEVGSKKENNVNRGEDLSTPSPKTSSTKGGQALGMTDKEATGEEVSLEELKNNWGKILEKVKEHNHSIKAFLEAGEPCEIEKGNWLVIKYRYPFHKDKMDELKNKKTVEGVIKDVAGFELRLKSEMATEGEKSEIRNLKSESKKQKVENSQKVSGQDEGKKETGDVMDVFGGGKVIDNG